MHPVVFGREVFEDRARVVRGTVIECQKLEITVGLGKDAFDSLRQIYSTVVDWQND